MSSKVPCLHFFPSDHIADTLHLSLEAQGCYILILFHTWNRNCQPFDDKELRSLLRVTPRKWRKIKEEISSLFDFSDGTFKQKRLEKTWKEALERSKKAKELGLIVNHANNGKPAMYSVLRDPTTLDKALPSWSELQ